MRHVYQTNKAELNGQLLFGEIIVVAWSFLPSSPFIPVSPFGPAGPTGPVGPSKGNRKREKKHEKRYHLPISKGKAARDMAVA